ncbi:hypothetical protein TanjilG_03604 [Lupinus angustifolius]|uniref:Uncharacterized protein n=1 Tax=Lupinus angustifolius TaxID=3871 RepID=A0A394DDX0_LUPAN|nr:hypothetical protein TanjilG_03604 [Lupinus angustifolius]
MAEPEPIKAYRGYTPYRLSRGIFLWWLFAADRRRGMDLFFLNFDVENIHYC